MMRARTLFAASLALAVAAPAGARAAKPLLIVSAEQGGEVVLVDPATAAVVGQIKVGARPRGLKLARDKRRVLVALAGPVKAAAKLGAPAAPAAPAPGGPGLAVVDIAARKVTKQVA